MALNMLRLVTRASRLSPRIYQASRISRATYSSSSVPSSFKDPSRPGLFYHLLQSRAGGSSVYAVSFLKDAPMIQQSKTVIGWLPASVFAPSDPSVEEEEAGLQDFVPNDGFVDVLHSSIQKALEKERDEGVKNEAIQRSSGWLHITDSRNIPALGRIGDPDDIIGSVLVEDGKVVPSTYQRMPSYRLCTSDGVTQLSEGLNKELIETLTELQEDEREEYPSGLA